MIRARGLRSGMATNACSRAWISTCHEPGSSSSPDPTARARPRSSASAPGLLPRREGELDIASDRSGSASSATSRSSTELTALENLSSTALLPRSRAPGAHRHAAGALRPLACEERASRLVSRGMLQRLALPHVLHDPSCCVLGRALQRARRGRRRAPRPAAGRASTGAHLPGGHSRPRPAPPVGEPPTATAPDVTRYAQDVATLTARISCSSYGRGTRCPRCCCSSSRRWPFSTSPFPPGPRPWLRRACCGSRSSSRLCSA